MGSKVNKKKGDIQKRILETKLEIDELHQELQRTQLLNLNHVKLAEKFVIGNQASSSVLRSPNANELSEVKQINTCTLTSAVNDENVKVPKTSRKKSPSKGSEAESGQVTVRPHKNDCAYDKEAVREYIIRQQQKRAEERRKQKETKQDLQIRKERLEKLHKVSLKIVAKNIRHKIGGSKSTERRQSSNGDSYHVSTAAGANQSKISMKSGFTEETGKNLIKKTNICGDSSPKPTFKPSQSEVSNQNFSSPEKNNTFLDDRLEYASYPNPIRCQQTSTNKLQHIASYGNGRNTLAISDSKNVTLRQPEIYNNVLKNSDTKLNMRRLPFSIQQEINVPHNEFEEFPRINTRQRVTENHQTRTFHEKLDTPIWLKAPSSLNFINSVRRKLKIVVSETPVCKDVGIQNSILEHKADENYAEKHVSEKKALNKKTDKEKICKSVSSKQDIFEMLQRQIKNNHLLDPVDNLRNMKDKDPDIVDNNDVNSQPDIDGLNENKNIKIHDLKSFLSHKLLSQSIEEIREDSRKPELNKNSENEDSDTSKNIPDLPSLTESSKLLDSRIQLSKRADSSTDIDKLEKLQLTRNFSLINNSKSEDLYKNKMFSRAADDCNIETMNYSDHPKSSKESIYSSDFHSPVASVNINSQERSIDDEIVHSIVTHSAPISEYLSKAESTLRHCHLVKEKIITESKFNDNTSEDMNKNVLDNYKKSPENLIKNGSQHVSVTSTNPKTSQMSNSKLTFSLKSPSVNDLESVIKIGSEHSSPIHTEGDTSTFNSSHQTTQPKLINKEISESVNENHNRSKFSNKSFLNNEAMSPLEAPLIYLQIDPDNQKVFSGNTSNLFKNIYFIAHNDNNNGKPNVTEIHLKFEAEVHLLNDFNESVKQFMTVQKAFEDLKKMNNNPNASKMQNPSKRDKQPPERDETGNLDHNLNMNNSRGSDLDLGVSQIMGSTMFSITGLTDLEISNLDDALNSPIAENRSSKNTEACNMNLIPLKMYEQLIKDEDMRIENLKTIIKIREKSLLDRTKAELALLEIQRKQLKEAGQLGKISDIKRKQRGILLKHQQERHEMQKLKHIQKAKSEERKKVLKEQRNLIKTQLTTNNMLTKIKVSRRKENKHSSPMKVMQYHSESICSDSSLYKMSSFGEEVLSISSSHTFSQEVQERVKNSVPLKHNKGALLMREVALRKRRIEAEELLKWHQKLLDEEKKITELESAAHTVINQIPSATFYNREPKNHSFKGSQLNTLWRSITGKEYNKFIDDRTYVMSQIAFERFCKSAKDKFSRSNNLSDVKRQNSAEIDHNEISVVHTYNIPAVNESDQSNSTMFSSQGGVQTSTSYTSDFENDSEKELRAYEKTHFELSKMSSISELIDSFSKIKDEISSLSKKSANNISINEEITSFASESKEKNVNIMNRINMLDISNLDNSISSVNNLRSRIESVPDIVKSSKLFDSNLGNVGYQSSNHSDPNISQNTSIIHTRSDNLNSSANEITSKSINVRSVANETNENSSKESVLKNVDTVEDILNMRLNESEHSILCNNESKSNTLEKTNCHVQNSYLIDSVETSSDVRESKTSQLGKLESNGDIEEDISIKNVELENTDLENITDRKQKHSHVSVNKSPKTSSKQGSNESRQSSLEETENKFLESIERSLRAAHTDLNSDVENSEITLIYSQISDIEHLNKLRSEENSIEDLEKSVSIKETLSTEIKEIDENDEQIATSSYNSNTFISSMSSPESKDDQKISNVDQEFHKADNNFGIISLLKLSSVNEVIKENTENVSLVQNDEFPEFYAENGDELMDTFFSVEKENNKNHSGSEQFVVPAEKLNDNCVNAVETEHQSSKATNKQCDDSDLISTSVLSKSITDLIANHLKNNKPETEEGETSFSILTEETSKSALAEQPNNDLKDSSFGEYEETVFEDDASENIEEKMRENSCEKVCGEMNSLINIPRDENNSKFGGLDTKLLRETDKMEHLENCAEESSKYEDQLENLSEISNSENDNNKLGVEKHVPERKTEVNEILFENEQQSSTDDLISQNSCSEDSPECNNMEAIEDTTIFVDEAVELLKKQLAIEQEIKQLEQQQKEYQTKQFDQQKIEPIPYVLLREIPNKPPPPYKPPAKMKTMMPSCPEDIEEVTSYAANVFYKAFLSNNLQNVNLTQSSFNLVSKRNINGQCCEFLFDLCKEFCLNHYSQFERKHPSWLVLKKKSKFSVTKPMDAKNIEKYLNKKIKELSGFQKVNIKESVIIKWSRKKRDYVDEVLVSESLAEENEWTEYDQDELHVKDQLTNDIMTKLLDETSVIFNKLFSQ